MNPRYFSTCTAEEIRERIADLDRRFPPKRGGRPRKDGSNAHEKGDREHRRGRDLRAHYASRLKAIEEGRLIVLKFDRPAPAEPPAAQGA